MVKLQERIRERAFARGEVLEVLAIIPGEESKLHQVHHRHELGLHP